MIFQAGNIDESASVKIEMKDLYGMSGEGLDEKSSDRLEGTRSVVGGLILKQGNNNKTNQ